MSGGYVRRQTQQDSVEENLIWLQRTRSDRLGLTDTTELPPTTGRVEHHPDDDEGTCTMNCGNCGGAAQQGPDGSWLCPQCGPCGVAPAPTWVGSEDEPQR